MKQKTLFRTILLTLVLSCWASVDMIAQKTADEVTATFFETFAESPERAMDYLRDAGSHPFMEQSEWMTTSKETRANLSTLGDYRGYEKINEINVGESYKLMRYLLKYQKTPVVLNMMLYRPDAEWKIMFSEWELRLDDEFNDNTKL